MKVFYDFIFHCIVVIIITILAQQRDTYYKSLQAFTLITECSAEKLLNILLCVSSIINSSWSGLNLSWGGRIAPSWTITLPGGSDFGLMWTCTLFISQQRAQILGCALLKGLCVSQWHSHHWVKVWTLGYSSPYWGNTLGSGFNWRNWPFDKAHHQTVIIRSMTCCFQNHFRFETRSSTVTVNCRGAVPGRAAAPDGGRD